ncbi:MAG: ThiF family adenylyltransferase [Candidatus Vogelbacteria bacterium]|nr:ThiF family adenylyltransferase [Candidatus Vogelbacteria bacterium]
MDIKVVGIGGIGTWLLPPLARFLTFSHPDTQLTLIDGDAFELKNRERQVFNTIGNKAQVHTEMLRDSFPELDVQAVPEYLTSENIALHVSDQSWILLCVDNHATRKLISDRSEELENVRLISGGNELTDGSVHVFIRENGQNLTLPLGNEYHTEVAFPEDRNPGEVGCDELVTHEPQLLFTNFQIAAQMLSRFYAILTRGNDQDEDLYCDLITGNCRSIRRRR